MTKLERFNLFCCLLALLVLTPTVIYLSTSYEKRCNAKGGVTYMSMKVTKCKSPQGDDIKVD